MWANNIAGHEKMIHMIYHKVDFIKQFVDCLEQNICCYKTSFQPTTANTHINITFIKYQKNQILAIDIKYKLCHMYSNMMEYVN